MQDEHSIDTRHGSAWEPCGGCWGQRRIWHSTPGHGLVGWERCPSCLGIGERVVTTAAGGADPS